MQQYADRRRYGIHHALGILVCLSSLARSDKYWYLQSAIASRTMRSNSSERRRKSCRGAGGIVYFAARFSFLKAICLHDAEQYVGTRPVGLTRMLRLHLRQRTVFGRSGRSEKSMRLPVVYEMVDVGGIIVGELRHFVVANVGNRHPWCILAGSSRVGTNVQGPRLAGFPACPARLVRWSGCGTSRTAVRLRLWLAPDRSARVAPGKMGGYRTGGWT